MYCVPRAHVCTVYLGHMTICTLVIGDGEWEEPLCVGGAFVCGRSLCV